MTRMRDLGDKEDAGVLLGSKNLHLKGRPGENWYFCTHDVDIAMGIAYAKRNWGDEKFEYRWVRAYHPETGVIFEGYYGIWRRLKTDASSN